MTLPRFILWLSCAIFAGLGGAFLVQPVELARFTDIELPTPTARALIWTRRRFPLLERAGRRFKGLRGGNDRARN